MSPRARGEPSSSLSVSVRLSLSLSVSPHVCTHGQGSVCSAKRPNSFGDPSFIQQTSTTSLSLLSGRGRLRTDQVGLLPAKGSQAEVGGEAGVSVPTADRRPCTEERSQRTGFSLARGPGTLCGGGPLLRICRVQRAAPCQYTAWVRPPAHPQSSVVTPGSGDRKEGIPCEAF